MFMPYNLIFVDMEFVYLYFVITCYNFRQGSKVD